MLNNVFKFNFVRDGGLNASLHVPNMHLVQDIFITPPPPPPHTCN